MRLALASILLAPFVLGCGGRDADAAPPTPDERLAEWEAEPAGTSVPVAIGFGGPLPDSAIAALLTRTSVRPYAVYLIAGGDTLTVRRDRSRASLEILGEAREQAAAQFRTALCAQPGRARALLEEPEAPDAQRDVLARVAALRASVPALETGVPVVYGLQVVGAVEDVRTLRDEAEVTWWEPAWRARHEGVDTVVVPDPPAPPSAALQADGAAPALGPGGVPAALAALAAEGVGSCEDAPPASEPR